MVRRIDMAMMGGVLVVLALALSCGVMVASAATAPPPAVDCSGPFNDLMPCIDYVNSNSSVPPAAACCTAFSATQKQRPECLCQLQEAFADPATAPGNATRATEIPVLCKVGVDYSKCSALLGLLAPTPAPAYSSPAPRAVTPRHAPIGAPTPAPGPAPPTGKDYDCTNSINDLSLCLEFVSGDGKAAPPQDCCTAVGSVQRREPVCICQLVAQASDGAQYGINATLAQSLPALCHVAADTSQCLTLLNSPLSPSSSPAFAPVPTPPSPSPSASPSTSPSTSPLTSPSTSPSPLTSPLTSPIEAPAPQQSVDCSNEYAMLQSCFTYVMANDTTPPSSECCTSFGSVVASRVVCLCQLLQTVGSGDPATEGINVTRALGLPTVCKVALNVGTCPALLGQPVSSPLPSSPPTGSDSPGSPSGDTTVTPNGEAPTPSSPSGASSLVVSMISWSFTITMALGLLMNFC